MFELFDSLLAKIRVDNGAPDQAVVPADRLRQPFVVWPNPALGDNDGAIDPRLILEPEDIVRPPDLVFERGIKQQVSVIVGRDHWGTSVVVDSPSRAGLCADYNRVDLVAGGPGLSGMIVSIVSPYRSHTGCTVPT
jgi:hypothetical protein